MIISCFVITSQQWQTVQRNEKWSWKAGRVAIVEIEGTWGIQVIIRSLIDVYDGALMACKLTSNCFICT